MGSTPLHPPINPDTSHRSKTRPSRRGQGVYARAMKDLIGAAFGFALLVFGLITSRDNHILVGTLTLVAFLVLYFQARKSSNPPEDPPEDP